MSNQLQADYALIGGTGLSDSNMIQNAQSHIVETPYGNVPVKIGTFEGRQICFLARHGADHSVPPHLINYRANIRALKILGVKSIIATAAVGSLNEAMGPNHFVLSDQFLDFTKSRKSTFHEGGPEGVTHVDVTEPYCAKVRSVLKKALEEVQKEKPELVFHETGTYVTCEGPRFETPAEIRMFKMLGGDLVGMTSVPECVLAREDGLCYANISYVTNFAAGISKHNLSHQEVLDATAANFDNLQRVIFKAFSLMPGEFDCCNQGE